jgi:hypothetical protein
VADGQASFEYADDALITIEKYISPERIAPYYALARNDKWIGIQLYERNCELSEALYGVIQGLEVTLRNSIHNLMTEKIGVADWYDRIGFDESEREAIDEAKQKIRERLSPVTPGRVVAELTFAFWVKQFASSYEKELWVKFLYRIFPLKMKRSYLHGRLVEIKTLRNRIAHHERIVGKRDLPQDYRDIIEAIGWVSPTIKGWVQHTNCFQERWEKKLKKTRKPPTADGTAPVAQPSLQRPSPANLPNKNEGKRE